MLIRDVVTPPPPVITSSRELEALCERLARAAFVTVDTEFMRERTYFARLCLVQVATPDEHALLDPLALPNLDPLRAVLASPSIVKVLHSGRQDIEIFHDIWAEVPTSVFDTQVAASVLGLGDQLAYGALIRELLGIEVSKAEGLTDWARRPLSPAQLAYAAADVTHLVPAYLELRQRVESAGRWKWVEDAMSALLEPATYTTEPQQAWRHVKRASGVSAAARAVVRELAAWREEEARRRDLPRRWVMTDEALVDVAKRAPKTLEDLASQRRVPDAFVRRDGQAVLARVALAVAAPAEAAPAGPPPARMTDDAQAVADLMGCLVRLRARERGVSVSVLANRATLEAVALSGEDSGAEVLTDWKREVVGEDLLALRAGRLRLVVDDGRVRVEPVE